MQANRVLAVLIVAIGVLAACLIVYVGTILLFPDTPINIFRRPTPTTTPTKVPLPTFTPTPTKAPTPTFAPRPTDTLVPSPTPKPTLKPTVPPPPPATAVPQPSPTPKPEFDYIFKSADLAGASATEIYVKVVDKDGNLIPGASVKMEWGDRSAAERTILPDASHPSLKDGVWIVFTVNPGTYWLAVNADRSQEKALEVKGTVPSQRWYVVFQRTF